MLLAAPAVQSAAAEPVRVLAAFTLKPALDQIAESYRRSGGEITLIYGSSPGLAWPRRGCLPIRRPVMDRRAGAASASQAGYGANLIGNHLVLIAARKGAAPPGAAAGAPALVRLIGVGPVVMCDPDSHPAGRMAKASLTTLGLWDSVAAKVARAENPLLAVRMVARGDAPCAVVFLTDAMTDPGVEIAFTFPDDSHPPIRYPVAILAKSSNPPATRFLDHLKSATAAETFRRLGYNLLLYDIVL